MNYLLRNVDPATWREVKAKAAADGVSIRSIVIAALVNYALGPAVAPGTRHTRGRLLAPLALGGEGAAGADRVCDCEDP